MHNSEISNPLQCNSNYTAVESKIDKQPDDGLPKCDQQGEALWVLV